MERSEAIRALVRYALDKGLIQPSEEMWAVNALLEALSLDSYTPPEGEPAAEAELPAILDALVDDAYARGDSTNAAVSSMSACVQSVEQLLATRYDSATRLLPL